MLNQIVLVGRLIEKGNIIKNEEMDKCLHIKISTPRSFKNEEGAYETDNFEIVLWNNIASNLNEWCNIGDLIGIKGRLQENENKIEIVAEKVTFLSSKKNESEEK